MKALWAVVKHPVDNILSNSFVAVVRCSKCMEVVSQLLASTQVAKDRLCGHDPVCKISTGPEKQQL